MRTTLSPGSMRQTLLWVLCIVAFAAACQTHAATVNVASGNSIQTAINGANPGDTINVAAGTFTEQLVISKNLVLIGAGTSSTFVQAPGALAVDATVPPGAGGQATTVVKIDSGAVVSITGFTIEGPGTTACGSIGYGVFVGGGATLTFNNDRIANIRDNPPGGCQNGVGIRVGAQSTGQVGTLNMSNSTVVNFQKAGIVVDNVGSSGTLSGNTVTGLGPLGIASNGIQISRGATATVTNNTITNLQCNLAAPVCGADPSSNAQSAGILLYDAGAVTATANIVSGNDSGVQAFDDTTNGIGVLTLNNNTLVNNLYENLFVESATLSLDGNTLLGSDYGVYVGSFGGDVSNSLVDLLGCNEISGASLANTQTVTGGGASTTPAINGTPSASACALAAVTPEPAPVNAAWMLIVLALGVVGAAGATAYARSR
jgi:hypothetical protein